MTGLTSGMPVQAIAHAHGAARSRNDQRGFVHRHQRSLRLLRGVAALLLCLACCSCGGQTGPQVKYEPGFLPVELVLDDSGIHVEGKKSLLTPIGTFSIGAQYSLPKLPADAIYVTIRDQRTKFDSVYELDEAGDSLTAVVNGRTAINVSNHHVRIDVSDGTIDSIKFEHSARAAPDESDSGWAADQWQQIQNRRARFEQRWDQGWAESWYTPFAMVQWAYDDSTIEKWHGLGFIWFLVRLLIAAILAIPDAILTFFFIVGEIGFGVFGPTGRNVIYGVTVLVAIAIGWSIVTDGL